MPERDTIVDLTFKNTEKLGITDLDRKAIYDIYCETDKGERFIVELQRAKQNYFRERTIYYSTFPIQEQAEKGEWNFNLKAVYCIGILDFIFDDYETEPEKSEYLHIIKLKNQNGKLFYDKLTYVYLEMPNFTKVEAQLESRLDKWLYFIKHLEDFQSIPAIFKDQVFEQAFEKAALANFRQADLEKYQASLKVFRDNKAVYDYAVETAYSEGIAQGIAEGKTQGIAEGKQEGRIEVVRTAFKMGLTIEAISKLTGLSENEVEKLR